MAPLALLDTDTLSEVMKGKDLHVDQQAIGGRYLFIVYILHEGQARVITCRDMDDKERKLYLKRGK